MKLVLIIAIAMAFASFAHAEELFNVPHYSQKDPEWGGNTLGFGSYTIARKGCFLSCITSIIASQGIKVNGQTPDPGNMNTWFKANNGFQSGLLLYRAAEKFGFKHEGIVKSKSAAIAAMNAGKFVLLHVESYSHWVVATGYDSNGYTIMDPANVETSYRYSEVPEVAIYAPPKSSQSSQPRPQTETKPESEPEQNSSSSSNSESLIDPPHFSQKDPKWGRKTLGFGSYSIAQKGCFLSAITSMIANEGIKVQGSTPNPDIMNSWFKSNNGFRSGLLQYKAAERFGFEYEGFVDDEEDIIDAMNQGKYALLHVENGNHWVLATGYDSNGYMVMDPADVRTTYDFDEVPEAAIYTAP